MGVTRYINRLSLIWIDYDSDYMDFRTSAQISSKHQLADSKHISFGSIFSFNVVYLRLLEADVLEKISCVCSGLHKVIQ